MHGDGSMIAQVGTISANNDDTIGRIIAEAMDKVGKDGIMVGVTLHAKHNRLTVLHIATLNKPIRSDLGYGPVETTSRSHVSAG